jgi:hypothetical protein
VATAVMTEPIAIALRACPLFFMMTSSFIDGLPDRVLRECDQWFCCFTAALTVLTALI